MFAEKGIFMTIQEILAGESKNVEFKVSRPEKSIKYMKTVVAFANGKGGCIIFGIDDKTRTIVGISQELVFPEMDAITNAISDSCEPVIIPDIYPQTINGKTIIIVEITAGKQRPYYIKSEGLANGVYMRVSGTTSPADRTISSEMYYEGEGRSYDSVIRRDMKITDKNIQKLCTDMKNVALKNCKNESQRQSVKDVTKNVLLSWGILAEAEDGSIHPTNAYVFLTGQDTFLSKIQCGMFKGTNRAIFVDKRDYEGMLWQQTKDAFQFVLRNIHLGAKIEGIYRKDIYELPPDSIRELIINAVMNCSFLQSSHIQVAIYDDRLEITSPGGLMPGVTIERMKEGYSKIRNRAIAHAFSYMNLIEGWGSGIPKLMQAMREYALPEPEFVDMEIALRINLYRKLPDTKTDILPPEINVQKKENPQKSAGKVPGKCRKSTGKIQNIPALSTQQKQIIGYIETNGQISSAEAETLLNVKGRRARAILNDMVANNLIAKIGASRGTRYILSG